MAGWHGNAETWTVLRADDDGGPDTLVAVSAFLRRLADSEVAMSAATPDALRRVADELSALSGDARYSHSKQASELMFCEFPLPDKQRQSFSD